MRNCWSHSHVQLCGTTATSEIGGVCGWTSGRVRQSVISRLAPSASGVMRTSAWMSLWSSAAYSGRLMSRCRSEGHTSELQSLMRISYAVFCLKKKTKKSTKLKYTTTSKNEYK